MLPTAMGSELAKARASELRAEAMGSDRRPGRRRRGWRAAAGSALVAAGERLRRGSSTYDPDPRPVRLP